MTNDEKRGSKKNICSRFTDFVISKFEGAFFSLGKAVGNSPILTIFVGLIVCGLCGIGMIKFTQENRSEKLWNPQDSEALRHQKLTGERYPVRSRLNIGMFESDNVLTSKMIKHLLAFDKEVKKILNGTSNQWDLICYRQGAICQTGGILEIWGYNETIINSLTDQQVLNDVNKQPLISLVTQRPIILERILGKIERNSGKVTKAKAVQSTYFLKNQEVYSKKTGQNEDPNGKLWEEKFGEVARSFDSRHSDFQLYYYSQTSFRAASGGAITGDISFLSIGYFLIIGYLAFMLGRFTRIEQKAWLALIGVLCVGLAILVSFGLSSAFGFFYGPVHSILPFLILGIGVDDVFVIIQSYEIVSKELPADCSMPYKLAATMKSAGVAISITSMTDVIAFLVGATTVLPALQSFCVYAGLGILAVYFFAITIFAACLALDIKRKEQNRDACCCCITLSSSYEPFACGKKDRLQMFFDNVFGKYLVKVPVKVGVLITTLALFAVGCYGVTELTQNFDFNLFLPPDSDATKFNIKSSEYFPNDGVSFSVYFGDIDYFNEQNKLQSAYDKLRSNEYIVPSSVSSWYVTYMTWVNTTYGNTANVDKEKRPINNSLFITWLKQFLNDKSGRIYKTDIKFDATNSKILYSRMHATHIKMKDSPTEVKAMDSVRDQIKSISFSKEAFPYTRFYIGWETNKIIAVELVRNLALAAACVFLVTLFLLANIWTSLMVFTCVILTLVDVGGMMYFWGLYIDTVTSVMLILAIGLCVDYAAHIGHAFMTANQRTRDERASTAISELGPAVFNGGFSTFLAFLLLAASTSYVFKTFFKVFFLVVVFGLFHGMVYFPTLLSLIGPKAYSTTSQRKDSLERSKSPNSIANEKHSDTSLENGSVTVNGNVTANGSTVVENAYITKNDGPIELKEKTNEENSDVNHA
ncbi:patched domain-containing protein 3-like isoform X2 [Rhopilema esculentum]|uniref:patched domain-containing protein 3-like isoform X2 n=1 Tax=Rhopilema esculentum TaxID=499914 RepID=UPI0031D10C05